jgi:hypothetical protein
MCSQHKIKYYNTNKSGSEVSDAHPEFVMVGRTVQFVCTCWVTEWLKTVRAIWHSANLVPFRKIEFRLVYTHLPFCGKTIDTTQWVLGVLWHPAYHLSIRPIRLQSLDQYGTSRLQMAFLSNMVTL